MTGPYRSADTRMAVGPRCLYCGLDSGESTTCRRCQVAVPLSRHAQTVACSCPRCAGLPLAPTPLGPPELSVLACARCRGSFVDVSCWSGLFEAIDGDRDLAIGGFVPPPPNAQPNLVALVRCPACRREMDRARFAQRSSVVIDICTMHGVWLDAAEIISLIEIYRRLMTGELDVPEQLDLVEAKLSAELAAAEAELASEERAAVAYHERREELLGPLRERLNELRWALVRHRTSKIVSARPRSR